jgi:hypothetical protein
MPSGHGTKPARSPSTRSPWTGVPLLVALALVLFPFVALSFFNHPQNDDWAMALHVRQLGYLGANAFWFKSWTGRYFAIAAICATPVVYGSMAAFKCMAALLIAGLVASSYCFVTVLGRGLPVSARIAGAMGIVALHLLQMPTVVEGVYWGSGAVAYEFGNALLLLLFAVVLDERGLGRLGMAAALVLAAAAAGTNEISMLYMDGMLALVVAARTHRSRQVPRSLALVLAVAIGASALVMFAPGERLRFSISGHPHDLRYAIGASLDQGVALAWRWLVGGPLVPVAILLVPVAIEVSRIARRKLPHPALAWALFLAVFFASFFPSLYGTAVVEARTSNVIHFYFVVGFLLSVANLAAWASARGVTPHIRYPLLVRGLLWTAAVLLTALPQSNLRTAYADLLSGTALRYDRERNERARIISRCATADCSVPPLTEHPRTIYFFDDAIGEGDGLWWAAYKDGGFAAYHGKTHIRVAPSTPKGG